VSTLPNPRLQRTRAAFLLKSVLGERSSFGGNRRAPLSRQPLGGTQAIAVFPKVALMGCLLLTSMACRHRYFTSPSTAMEPTIKRGEQFRMTPLGREDLASIRVGDIVVFRRVDKPAELLVKRVVGIGGDAVEIRDKRLIRNGAAQEEPYVAHVDPYLYSVEAGDTGLRRDQMARREIKAGYLFVLGDNRDNSLDSRTWGDIPVDSVLGRVVLSH